MYSCQVRDRSAPISDLSFAPRTSRDDEDKFPGSCEKDVVRVASSPRDFWGYSRLPFIVVSENRAIEGRQDKFGVAREFKYLAHEAAHFWWMIAGPNMLDDRINEGLAEFSSFRAAEEMYGRDFANQIEKE